MPNFPFYITALSPSLCLLVSIFSRILPESHGFLRIYPTRVLSRPCLGNEINRYSSTNQFIPSSIISDSSVLFMIDDNNERSEQNNKKDSTNVPQLKSMNDLIAAEGLRGFDILGLSRNPEYFFVMREAEIKHGRLAMLAAFGWPFSELYHYAIAVTIEGSDVIDNIPLGENGRAPSVLNGGLDNLYVLLSLCFVLMVGAFLEMGLMQRRAELSPSKDSPVYNFYDMWNEDGWDAPGNYGFDPLSLGKSLCPNAIAKVKMQAVEIFNGRAAMLATVGFVVQEFVTGMPVVSETPQFFGL